MRFLYFYLMENAPEWVRVVVPEHIGYWRGLRLDNYLGGPLADRSGGLITFEAASAAEAESIVAHDPFVLEGLVEKGWTKEWVVEEA